MKKKFSTFLNLVRKQKIMQRTSKETSPINHILKTKYNQSDAQLQALREYFYGMVMKQKSARGTQLKIESELETRFVGIKDYFPLPNWEQRVRNPDLSFSYQLRTKSWHESVESYSKGVTEWVKKNRTKTTDTLCDALNIGFLPETPVKPVEESPKQDISMSEIAKTICAVADRGAKSIKTPDGWEIQF